MRPAERDILLLALAAASGSADGWSYLGLGHAFVANMTGNTVLCGLALTGHGDLLNPPIALAFYVCGAILATFFTRHVAQKAEWHRAISLTLLLEAALMAAAEIRWTVLQLHGALRMPAQQDPLTRPLLVAVALAIGMQSGAMLRLHVPGIVTTYITGTWTNLASNLVKLPTRERHRPARERVEVEERLVMQFAVVVVYFLSAVLTGLLTSHQPIAAGATPVAAVLFTAIYGLARG